jgi:hypothetical protein
MRKNRDLFLRNNRALLTKLRTLILLTYHDVEEMPIQVKKIIQQKIDLLFMIFDNFFMPMLFSRKILKIRRNLIFSSH